MDLNAAHSASQAQRVLVVDDNKDAAAMAALVLGQMGHIVRQANDGAAALALALEFRPQIVLLDLSMPEVDGFEVAQRLREMDATRDVRIFALSGHVEHPYIEASSEAEFDAYLLKPLDTVVLTEAIAAARSPRRPTGRPH